VGVLGAADTDGVEGGVMPLSGGSKLITGAERFGFRAASPPLASSMGPGSTGPGWNFHSVRPKWEAEASVLRGDVVIQRLRAMGIRDRPISPRSPWQNGYSERLIGSIRRDCLDHVVVFGERDLRHLLNSYQKYYNEARTHLSLHKNAPIPRTIQTVGRTLAMPVLGGLHHQYFRA
jgi:hypothetical protein